MSVKSGIDFSSLISAYNRSTRKSLLFNVVGPILDKNSKASDLVHHGFRTIIGNGFNTDIGTDN